MNLTTPHAANTIKVLRTRQLEATKQRIIAELRSLDISKVVIEYATKPDCNPEIGIDAESSDGAASQLDFHIPGSFQTAKVLLERFAWDLVAHLYGGTETARDALGRTTVLTRHARVNIVDTVTNTDEITTDTTL